MNAPIGFGSFTRTNFCHPQACDLSWIPLLIINRRNVHQVHHIHPARLTAQSTPPPSGIPRLNRSRQLGGAPETYKIRCSRSLRNRLLKERGDPGIADDDSAVADRTKRFGPAVAEKRSADRSNSASGRRSQVDPHSPEFRGLPLSPACAPCNRLAEQHSLLALSL